VHLQVSGPAAPDVVWHRYARFDLWPTWSPQIRRVEAGAAELAPGVRGVVHGPLGVAVAFTVETVDSTDPAERSWSWTVHPVGPGPLARVGLGLRHGVRPASGGGTLTTLDLAGPTPVVLAYGPLALLALRRLVRA
jgi:hypothetical protein